MDYQSLKKIVQHHDNLYYVKGKPVLSDAEYDSLFDKLLDQEKLQGWKDPDSPTMRVGGEKGKIKHPFKLYSLKKVYEKSDVDTDFDIELPKIDGVNLSLSYNDGLLTTMLTRGDGEFGESVIHLSSCIAGIPKKLSTTQFLVFVGEVVTDNIDVENFRNYVAGALGLKDAKQAMSRNLRFIVHDVLGLEADFEIRLKVANKLGFNTVIDYDCSKYPQDGIVYRVSKYEKELNMGYTAKFPRFAVALKKKEAFTGSTCIRDIEWAIGRSGVITPVALVDTVTLDDAQVSRVILHNYDFVTQNNLGPGDLILIERRITPQFVKVIEHSQLPRQTIEDIERIVGQPVLKKGPKLFVSSDTGHRLVEHFSKTLGILGLGPQTIKEMDFTHPMDLFAVKDWSILGKNGLKVNEELYRPKEYYKVLAALGIPGVGINTAKLIVSAIPSFENIRDIETTPIKGIGPTTIKNILDWVEVNEDWVYSLPYDLEQHSTPSEADNISRKIVISGKLDMTKRELGEHLNKFGFVLSDSVTKDCYALISSGEETDKTKKAEKYGLPIYNYWNSKAMILKGMF